MSFHILYLFKKEKTKSFLKTNTIYLSELPTNHMKSLDLLIPLYYNIKCRIIKMTGVTHYD